MTNEEFYEIVASNGYYSTPGRLRFYLEQYLFKDVDITGMSLIDIGGGCGIFAFFAAINGAKDVVVMEPEVEGSSAGMKKGFDDLKALLCSPENISWTGETLQSYDRVGDKFDIVLMHNSINHLDEESCVVLHENANAQVSYQKIFTRLKYISSLGATYIICDCSNRNLFGDIGLRNPMAKSIEWHKHQPPEVWAALLKKEGFSSRHIEWTTPSFLGRVGRSFFGSKVIAYLWSSHFRLTMIGD
jgi:hypothetical protein